MHTKHFTGLLRLTVPAALLCLSLFGLLACGGNDAALPDANGNAAAQSGLSAHPGSLQPGPDTDIPDEPVIPLAELESRLYAELAALGKDPQKTVAIAPSGDDNAVFDLQGSLETEWSGDYSEAIVNLSWTDVLVGDYDMNGEVGLSDLVWLARYYNKPVGYAPQSDAITVPWYPNKGINNWRKARIDGDHNGRILSSDITPMALHWHEHQDGYNIYRRGPGESDLTVLPNQAGSDGLTIARSQGHISLAGVYTSEGPLTYSIVDNPQDAGDYTYYVAAIDKSTGAVGPPSNQLQIHVTQRPIAEFTAVPDPENPDLGVLVNASGSVDPDGSVAKYIWRFSNDFSDGWTTEVQRTFEYYESGTYDITLIVEDNEHRRSLPVTRQFSTSLPPVASFTAKQVPGEIPNLLELDASASVDPDGSIVEYRWSFFDPDLPMGSPFQNTTTTESIVQIKGNRFEAMPFDVYLFATDNSGLTSKVVKEVQMQQSPDIRLHASPNITGMADFTASLNIWVYPGTTIDNCTFDWDFDGDGEFELLNSDKTSIQHVYREAGEFNPTVLARSDSGLSSSGSDSIIVEADSGEVRWHSTYLSNSPHPEHAACLAVVDGHPAISFAGPQLEHESYVVYSRADDPLGQTWNNPVVLDPAPGLIPGTQYARTELRIISGRPAVAYFRESADGQPVELCYLRANDSVGNTWLAPHVLSTHSSQQLSQLSMAEVNGQPAIAYADRDENDYASLKYIRALDPDGMTWTLPRTLNNNNGNAFPYELCLNVIGGKPAVSFDYGGLRYVRANDADGATWQNPLLVTLRGGWHNSLVEIDGRPAISHFRVGNLAGDDSDLYYSRAEDALGDEWPLLDHIIAEEGDVGRYSCMAIINGVPAVAYLRDGYLVDYIEAQDPAGNTWKEPEHPNIDGSNGQLTLVELDGRPVILADSSLGIIFSIRR